MYPNGLSPERWSVYQDSDDWSQLDGDSSEALSPEGLGSRPTIPSDEPPAVAAFRGGSSLAGGVSGRANHCPIRVCRGQARTVPRRAPCLPSSDLRPLSPGRGAPAPERPFTDQQDL